VISGSSRIGTTARGTVRRNSPPLSEVSRDLACGDELLEGGLCAQKEPFAGFGRPDTASRADEERRADARLECAHRLADRRWGHPQFRRGRSVKTAVLGTPSRARLA
jgi:hypothetical protein